MSRSSLVIVVAAALATATAAFQQQRGLQLTSRRSLHPRRFVTSAVADGGDDGAVHAPVTRRSALAAAGRSALAGAALGVTGASAARAEESQTYSDLATGTSFSVPGTWSQSVQILGDRKLVLYVDPENTEVG